MLIGRFYPVEAGAEIQCRRLSRELIRKNHGVFILTQSLPKAPSKEHIDGIPLHRVGLAWKGRLGSFSYVVAGFLWLFRHRNSFDILHVHMASSPAILALLAGKFMKKPVVIKFAGSRTTGDVQTSSSTWHGRLKLGFLRRQARYLVCPSREIGRELQAAGFAGEKITVIPNGVDTGAFSPAQQVEKERLRKMLSLPAEKRIAVYSGRLQAGKGLDLLILQWAEIARDPVAHDWLLVIVGDGPLAERLNNDYGRLESVRFTGWKKNVSDYLRAADLFILPSLGEGMSNALIEAMSCGLPCIATGIGGASEVLRDGDSGFLVPPGDRQALQDRIVAVMGDMQKASDAGMKAREYVVRNLSIEQVEVRYEALYRRMREDAEGKRRER